MIVPQTEIDLVLREKRPRRQMWVPVTRGTHGERQACPFEKGIMAKLCPRPRVKGVPITPTEHPVLTTLSAMTDSDATRQGLVGGLRGAREAWEATHGIWEPDREVWRVDFNLGDHSELYEKHQERFLRSKMGGGPVGPTASDSRARGYTTDPGKAVHGEGAVPSADLAPMAARAERQREEAAEKALRQTLRTIEASIRDMEPHEASLAADVKKDLRWLRRRAQQIKRTLGEPVAA